MSLLWVAIIHEDLVNCTSDVHPSVSPSSMCNYSSRAKSSNHTLSVTSTTVLQNITFLALVPCGSLVSASQECPESDVFVYPAVKLAAEFINNRNSVVCKGRESRTLRVHVNVNSVETGVGYE